MKNQKNVNKKQGRGQSLVELAISLMVILLLLLGTIDFGVALFAWTSMRDAAQEGAVYGSIKPTDTTGIKNRVISAANDLITIAPADITIVFNGNACEGSGGSPATPNTIQVKVEHLHPVSTPLIGALVGSQNITLRAQVTNTILSPVCP